MKTKRQNHHRGWKQALSVLLVFALVVGVVLSVPALSGVAYAAPALQDGEEGGASDGNTAENTSMLPGGLDLTQNNSITLNLKEDMTDPNLEKPIVDLYRVASAVPLPGYIGYAYCIDSTMQYYNAVKEFISSYANWHKEELSEAPAGYPEGQGVDAENFMLFYYDPLDHTKEPDVREQAGLAECLAEQYLVPQRVESDLQASYLAPYQTTTVGTPATGLPAGLYMCVVHGDMDRSEYVVLQYAENAFTQNVCTIAYSDTKVYTFQPHLISVPTWQTASGTTDTTLEGTWQYAVQANVKSSSENRYAELQLEKSLAGGIVNGNAPVFVFHVTAYAPGVQIGGTPVYEKIITLRYDANDSDSLRTEVIDKIPIGSTVVITEEYSGASYKFSEAQVSTRPSGDPDAAGTAYDAVERTENGIIIREIPAGRIHLTAPSGDSVEIGEGTTATVTIVNTPTTTTNGGGSVINSFTLDSANGWTWTNRTYNAQTGQWEVGGDNAGTQTEEG